jgi:hypothetical protein
LLADEFDGQLRPLFTDRRTFAIADGPSFGRLQWGDEIVEIDGRPVEFATLAEVTSLLRSVAICIAK